MKPFEMLRRHEYVQLVSAPGDPQWYGSERVKVPVSELDQIVDQIAGHSAVRGTESY